MNKTKRTTIVYIAVALVVAIVLGITHYNVIEDNDKVAKELSNNKALLASTQDKLTTTQSDLQIEIDKSIALNEEIEKLKTELEIANTTMSDLTNKEYKLVYLGDFKITHYCRESYKHICGSGAGVTATGTQITPGRTVAVDPKVIPYGTQMYIEGYGWRTAEDCGGAIKGNDIDVAVETHSQAMDMGVKHGGVWILIRKNS